MNKTIYFIRHAESPFVFGQERERPLSEKGHQDAQKISEMLKEIQFDIIVSSPYTRAIQTIKSLANEHEIHLFEELKEKQLKGAYKLESQQIEAAIKQSFEDIDYKLHGGESTREVQNRAIPIIKELLNNATYNTIAIGTHGNILTAILNYYDREIGYYFWKVSTKPDIYIVVFNQNSLVELKRLNFINY